MKHRSKQRRAGYRVKGAMGLFFREDGYTTVGAALAVLLTCSLVCMSAWAYEAQSRTSSIQSIADAAALAAENEVAEFDRAVKVADATLLSMSLTGIVLLGVGTVCCCVPAAAPLGERLVEAGAKVIEKRSAVAKRFSESLNAAQAALPALAVASAEAVILENASDDLHLLGYVEVVPWKGEAIDVPDPASLKDASDTAESNAEEAERLAKEADEASTRANEALERGFEADCGAYPGACMRERAETLSTIPPIDNPLYESSATWTFSVALERARAYYRCRYDQERPASASMEEEVRSALRKRFYDFAIDELARGRAYDDGVSEPDLYFPLLPKNADELKRTSLYTDPLFPVSGGAHRYLCAWSGCPSLAESGSAGMGSLSHIDAGTLEVCPHCGVNASYMGRVMAASSSIDNGFEYHYRIVADAAEEYESSKKAAVEKTNEAKDLVTNTFDALGRALADAVSYRIEAFPPGRFGVVVAVSADASAEAPAAFVTAPGDLGSFTAISASTCVEDPSENVMASLLDGVREEVDSELVAGGDVALGIWGVMIDAYGGGVDALASGIESILNGIPLIGPSGLGTWASDELTRRIRDIGLEPASTGAPKPVVINTRHVLDRVDGPLAEAIMRVKEAAP